MEFLLFLVIFILQELASFFVLFPQSWDLVFENFFCVIFVMDLAFEIFFLFFSFVEFLL